MQKLTHFQPEDVLTDVLRSIHVQGTLYCRLVDESPLRYLTRWRLNKAAIYLRTSPGKLTEIARLVGYDSEVALSKAFKRYYGIAPGAYRHSLLAPRDGS